MNKSATGQVSVSAAEVYDEFFLPALFQEWANRVAEAANVQSGQRVLDVACGTGVLARAVAERVGERGSVVGLDLNEGMLAVARRKPATIEWRHGHAEALPFDSNSFDAVVSQFGLMFFEDQPAAIQEIFRVLRPGGQLAIAVWDALEQNPGYAALTALLRRLFGDQVADALRAPFSLGDSQRLSALFTEVGFPDMELTTIKGAARFPSIRSWIHTEMRGWIFADLVDDAQIARLLEEAEKALRPFVTAEGTVIFSMPAHIVTATKA